MFINTIPEKKTGKTLIILVESYRKDGKVKQRTIETIGYLEDLKGTGPGQFPDPIAHFRDVAKQRTLEAKAEQATVTLTYRANEVLPLGTNNVKNVGYMPLSRIYEELEIERFILNRQRNLKIKYSLNRVLRTLLFGRILFPDSKKGTFEDAHTFFEKIDFSLDDVYRSLTLLDRYSKDLQIHLHKQVTEKYGRSTDRVYYDVTNYYFESETRTDLRAKGVSKEHRKTPIVQMGLLMDTQGLPIAYQLFPGNTNDCETLMPMLQTARNDFDVGRFVLVADRGLNSSNNIAMALAKGDGYVYGQSILKATNELKAYCLKPDGYHSYSGTYGDDSFRIKSRITPRIIQIENAEGKKVRVTIDEKQVFFYSEKYARRARAEREEALEKARQLIARPALYNQANEWGVRKYIANLMVDPNTGEILTPQADLYLNEDRIREEAQYDGYYAVTSSELDRADTEIMDLYRGLWKIEESFRLTKSDLEARPVFVSTDEHVNAHFLTCFIALLFTRILELKTEHRFPLGQMLEDMRRTNGTLLNDNTYLFGYYTEVLQAIGDAFEIDFSRKFCNRKEILTWRKRS